MTGEHGLDVGALLAASTVAWLYQLTARTAARRSWTGAAAKP